MPDLKDSKSNSFQNPLNQKESINLGGFTQKFFLRGENKNNPVVLYLHGGPAAPELPFLIDVEQYPRIEQYFNVCYWDQTYVSIFRIGGHHSK